MLSFPTAGPQTSKKRKGKEREHDKVVGQPDATILSWLTPAGLFASHTSLPSGTLHGSIQYRLPLRTHRRLQSMRPSLRQPPPVRNRAIPFPIDWKMVAGSVPTPVPLQQIRPWSAVKLPRIGIPGPATATSRQEGAHGAKLHEMRPSHSIGRSKRR